MDTFLLFLFSKVASTEVFIGIILLIILALMTKRKHREAGAIAIGAILMSLVVTFLKWLFHIARPLNPGLIVTGYAFPSGHAAASAFLLVLLFHTLQYVKYRSERYALGTLGISIVVAISISRIVYNVHTLFQVCVGIIIGGLCGILTLIALRYFKTHTS